MKPPIARVYIIESPKPEEIRTSVFEGRAIAETLRLAGHQSHYWLVVNQEQFVEVLKEIEADLGPLNSQEKIIPFFHISAHGNEDGIALTNDIFISWQVLSRLLWDVGNNTQRINHSGHALAHITMSACKGIHGSKMWEVASDKAPAISLIGPTQDISWTDSLTGWIVFYHLILTKGAHPPDTVQVINNASGVKNGFMLYPAQKEPY